MAINKKISEAHKASWAKTRERRLAILRSPEVKARQKAGIRRYHENRKKERLANLVADKVEGGAEKRTRKKKEGFAVRMLTSGGTGALFTSITECREFLLEHFGIRVNDNYIRDWIVGFSNGRTPIRVQGLTQDQRQKLSQLRFSLNEEEMADRGYTKSKIYEIKNRKFGKWGIHKRLTFAWLVTLEWFGK